jgi:putative MATE family efflux protein
MIRNQALGKGRALIQFFYDREYYSRLFGIALPIAFQSFIMNSLSMVGVLMIGQLGEQAVAGVGLANQVFFLLQLGLFGVTSGSSMFTAQFWGRRDVPNIRRVLGLALILAAVVGLFFTVLAIGFPQATLGFYTRDPVVIGLGSQYLRLFGASYLFFAVTSCFAAVLRSTGDVRTPLLVSIGALGLNTLGSYTLIFGKFGLPALGVTGAALSGLGARVLECSALLFLVYRLRTPVAARLGELFDLDRAFAQRVLRPVLPVAFNEVLWSVGITTYSAIYARIGTDAIAAMNIASSIDSLAVPVFIGIANACAILVGNLIGSGDEAQAHRYATRSLALTAAGALFMGGLIYLASPAILEYYKVSPQVIGNARSVLGIIASLLWLRMSNLMLFVGVFRSGGDTRFAFLLDAGMIWALGVPMALLGAFVFDLPVAGVYLMVMSDEAAKWVVGMWRFFSRRWIHNLVHGGETPANT